MTNNKDDKKHNGKNDHSGKQGFGSMDKDKVKEIASKGGHTTHKGDHDEHNNKSKSHNEKDDHNKSDKKHDDKHDHSGKQGFASMDKEKVKEIASKGGQASHKGNHHDDKDE